MKKLRHSEAKQKNILALKASNTPTTIFSLLFQSVKPYFFYYMLLLLAVVYLGLHISLEPYILKIIIDRCISYQNAHSKSHLIQHIFNIISYPISLFLLASIMYIVSSRIINYVLLLTIPKIKKSVALMMLNYIWQHSESFFKNELSGSISSKISDMQNSIKNIIDNLRRILRLLSEAIIAIGMTTLVDKIFALIIFLWAFIFISFSIYFSKKLNYLSFIYSKKNNDSFGRILDCISNIANIKIFSSHNYELQYINKHLDETLQKDKDLRRFQIFCWNVLDTVCYAMIIIIIIFLVYLNIKNSISVGDFSFILLVSIAIKDTIFNALEQFEDFSTNIGACKQALSILTEPHEIQDASNAKEFHVIQGKIEFKNIYFSYIPASEVFKDLNVIIQGKQKVGLVGLSGSGKSTFTKLIARLYDVKKGSISIDEQNIREVTQNSLRKNIGFIIQEPILFHRSIFENIQYGSFNTSESDIINAAKAVHLHDFILSTPYGYNTLVGGMGLKLSGGERQLISLARAFLKDVPIMIFDESTSSLDAITEQMLQKGLKNLMKDRTVIIIAHKLSTISHMDRILVFDKGRIIEDGSHQELLNKNRLYAKLWKNQRDGYFPEQIF